jgi:hypothetical protein
MEREILWNYERYVKLLKNFRLAVEALYNHDANILTSEGIFKFLFINSEKQSSALSSMLLRENRKKNSLNAEIKIQ